MRGLHRAFVEAGIDIILTNSFGANPRRLALHRAEDRVRELNVAAAQIARASADRAGRPVLVAGSIGPTGDIFAAGRDLCPSRWRGGLRRAGAALAEGGADLLWIETISAPRSSRPRSPGRRATGLPIVATMTFDTHGRTMMGLTPEDAMALRGRPAGPSPGVRRQLRHRARPAGRERAPPARAPPSRTT